MEHGKRASSALSVRNTIVARAFSGSDEPKNVLLSLCGRISLRRTGSTSPGNALAHGPDQRLSYARIILLIGISPSCTHISVKIPLGILRSISQLWTEGNIRYAPPMYEAPFNDRFGSKSAIPKRTKQSRFASESGHWAITDDKAFTHVRKKFNFVTMLAFARCPPPRTPQRRRAREQPSRSGVVCTAAIGRPSSPDCGGRSGGRRFAPVR
jgi:hypothetical protein